MNKEELKKLCEEEFKNNTLNHLDSALIFFYISTLEKQNVKLQTRIDKAIEYINYSLNNPLCDEREALKQTLNILRGEDNE